MFFIAAPLALKAQSATEEKVKFMKAEHSAAVATFNYPGDIVKAALDDRLTKAGFGKQKKQQGFISYKGVAWSEVSGEKLDVYTKVDSRKSKSTVYLMAAKGYDNFVSSGTDEAAMEKMKKFLDGFADDLAAYQHQLDVAKKEAEIEKAEKAYADHMKKQKKLEGDRAKLAEELEKMKKTNR